MDEDFWRLRDQIRLADIQRISRYPSSLEDLTYLEIEAILEREPSGLEDDVPGLVRYEKEYRLYGRDTLALVYYKTCYL